MQTRSARKDLRTALIISSLFVLPVGVILAIGTWFELTQFQELVTAIQTSRATGRLLTLAEIEQRRPTLSAEEDGAIILASLSDRLSKLGDATADFNKVSGAWRTKLCERWSDARLASAREFMDKYSDELTLIDQWKNYRNGRVPLALNSLTSHSRLIPAAMSALQWKYLQLQYHVMSGETGMLGDDIRIMRNMVRCMEETPSFLAMFTANTGQQFITDGVEQALTLRQFDRKQLMDIERMLAPTPNLNRIRAAMLTERANQWDCVSRIIGMAYPIQADLPCRLRLPGWRGMFYRDQTCWLRLWDTLIDASEIPGESPRISKEVAQYARALPVDSFPLTRTAIGDYGGVFEGDLQSRMRLSVTRTALAIECWRLDHGGFPESLDELVPLYLSEVPFDLFADTPLGYQRYRDHVIVYSIGVDKKKGVGRLDEAWRKGESVPRAFVLLAPEVRGRVPTATTASASRPADR